jgi:hypothetical protein
LYRERIAASSKNRTGRTPCFGYEAVAPDFTHHIVGKVEQAHSADVFDIEVDRHHNFMTDGIVVSNSWGTAFDINAPQNFLGNEPAKLGQPGCILELLPIAYSCGFYWGGLFTRKDGMHFELAVIDD